MRASLQGSYVDFVIFMGETERYPKWFQRELDKCIYTDESRYTFWVDRDERKPDYYEKKLVEEFSIIIRNSSGDIHVTDYDIFQDLYITFRYDAFTNSGLAAFEEDSIEYVECMPGILDAGYPHWFYEYFTEAVNLPDEFDGFMLFSDRDEVKVTEHCVILRNRFDEIRTMTYKEFSRYYDDSPSLDREIFVKRCTTNKGE